MGKAQTLYDEDFYAWTQDQAAKLRNWPQPSRPNDLDLEHIAEEVEDLGKRDRREIASLLRQIALHLLQLERHPVQASRSHRQAEVDQFRSQIRDAPAGSPSLQARLPDL